MRHHIAIALMFGLIVGCSDSDTPATDAGTDSSVTQQSTPTITENTPVTDDPTPMTQPEQPANVVQYECNDGAKFEADLLDQGIAMVINDISYDLRQQPATSGTLYSDGSTSFQVNEDQALLTNEQGTIECQLVAAAAAGGPGIPLPPELQVESIQGD